MNLGKLAIVAVTAAGIGLAGCDQSTTINVDDVVSQVESGLKTACVGAPVVLNIAQIVEAAVSAGKDVTSDTALAKSVSDGICNSIKGTPVASKKRGGPNGVVYYPAVDGVLVQTQAK